MIMQLKQRLRRSGTALVLADDADAAKIQHPQLQSLYLLWRRKCAGRPAPARADFAVEEWRPWLGHLMLLDCIEGEDFRYRLYGTELAQLFGYDLSGLRVSELEALIGGKPIVEYRQVRRDGLPTYVSRASPSSRNFLAVDKLTLPLMEDGAVSKILAAIYLSDDKKKA